MQKVTCGGLAAVILLIALVRVDAQTGPPLSPTKTKQVEALIAGAISEAKIPGLSLAIVSGDRIVYSNGFGVADLENAVPARPATVYRLGSLSKTITAVAVMRLVEHGKLDLDAPVQKYCPAFPVKQWPVTSRQLLAHLGGVRDYDRQNFLAEYFSTRHYTNVTESLDIFKNNPLVQEPGTKYAYSTYGYNVLGCAIEGASSTTYPTYVTDNIFKPAGMNATGVDDAQAIIHDRAHGYGIGKDGVLRNTGLADTSNKIPAGGLVSTAEDMCRFYLALMAGKLVSPATLGQMWTAQKTRDGQAIQYGLGWRVGARNGGQEVFHGGAAAGFSTFLYLVPEKKIAVAIMTDLELLGSKQRDDLARQIADIVAS
jgi:CubicO group peptidase (beta-lactamase class C family)